MFKLQVTVPCAHSPLAWGFTRTASHRRMHAEAAVCAVLRRAGRRATVALVRRSSALRSLLRLDAKPFVAASLRQLFDRPPKAFHPALLDLTPLFGR